MKKSLPKVKILLEGYASADTGGHSCSTISLVQDENLNIIVDPGTVPDQSMIIKALKKHGLSPDNINVVYITHSHVDHYRNTGMFKGAKTLNYDGWWISDIFEDYCDPSENIKMIETPGHSVDGTTMLVATDKDKVAICGDVFWKENFPKKDPFAFNLRELDASRKRVLEIADYIIPGHGKMFKVKKPLQKKL